MSAALAAAAVLAALAVLLLAVPLAVSFRFTGLEELGGELRIGWLFGLVRIRAPIPGGGGPRSAGRREKAAKRRGEGGSPFAVLRQTAFRRRVYRLIQDLFRAAHARKLRLHLRLGLGDPADTGRLWALAGPLNAAAQNLPGAEVVIEPEFAGATLQFEASGRLRLVPLQLLAIAVGFALSPASIRAWRTMWGGRG